VLVMLRHLTLNKNAARCRNILHLMLLFNRSHSRSIYLGMPANFVFPHLVAHYFPHLVAH
jgi:hypothetical protein